MKVHRVNSQSAVQVQVRPGQYLRCLVLIIARRLGIGEFRTQKRRFFSSAPTDSINLLAVCGAVMVYAHSKICGIAYAQAPVTATTTQPSNTVAPATKGDVRAAETVEKTESKANEKI